MTKFRGTSIDGAKATAFDRNHAYLFLGGLKNTGGLFEQNAMNSERGSHVHKQANIY